MSKKLCSKDEWYSKSRELKISKLLAEDCSTIEQWLNTHSYFILHCGSKKVTVKNPYENVKIIYK